MSPRLSSQRVIAIVPAAGPGKRLGARDKKPFVELAGRPIIAHTLKALGSFQDIDGIIVAVESGSIERLKSIIKKCGLRKIDKIVAGGRTRAESVRNCFQAIDNPCETVLIHDGARPFPGPNSVRDCIRLARRFGGCISAIPVTDTVKLADGKNRVVKTLDRKRLWRAQTPQAFRYELLKCALDRVKRLSNITDDASLLERAGSRVKILEGSVMNIKVTSKDDLKIAEALLKRK